MSLDFLLKNKESDQIMKIWNLNNYTGCPLEGTTALLFPRNTAGGASNVSLKSGHFIRLGKQTVISRFYRN